MSVSLQRLDQTELSELATTFKNAGIAGAGGAGFPAHAKWERLDEVDYLLVNHQESEPNYYIDKWLGRERADEFGRLFDALLDRAFDAIVIGAKEKDRDGWMRQLEAATDGRVYGPSDLPLDPETESGVVFAYTDDQYEYGMENVLLRLVAGVVMGDDLPMDHGWIVQNTETLHNVFKTLERNEPMTHKYVHVDGNVPDHRFLKVPIGTPASHLLAAAGRDPDDIGEDELLADGGPGWCFEIEEDPSAFGTSKRTNCLTVLDADVVEENTLGGGRINVLNPIEWSAEHETEPSTHDPDRVRIPMITNSDLEGIVSPSRPVVEPGDEVTAGEMIAVPSGGDIGNAQHASIGGEVTEVSDRHVEITRQSDQSGRTLPEAGRTIYWTWCVECGEYVARPERERFTSGTKYVCESCR
ncbi:NADH dehydrogenase subunit [Halostella sp. JP-L12]|uniref:NADH dehydrogenase subunit n=1 Tax=Halostella TaxID=1843185 RepID=UPI000EF7A59E|nr:MULTISPECIES: NADH dehydrogenase subunit [Halostella]NHN48367.1 NADH dehydrogenase subunit [Halostella sp. JP-L12]